MKHKIIAWVLVIGLFAGLFLASGCTEQVTGAFTGLVEKDPEVLEADYISFTEDSLTIRVYLFDENYRMVNSEGDLNVRIVSDDGSEVFLDDFEISTTVNDGDEIVLEGIEKSYTNIGTAYLTFTDNDINLTAEEEIYDLPMFTETEKRDNLEQAFLDDAKTYNLAKTKGDLKITLVRAGYYTGMFWEDNDEKVFRIDVTVENRGSEDRGIYPEYGIIVNSVQYRLYADNGFSTVYEDARLEGYFFTPEFENFPQDLENEDITIKLGKALVENEEGFDDFEEIEFIITF